MEPIDESYPHADTIVMSVALRRTLASRPIRSNGSDR